MKEEKVELVYSTLTLKGLEMTFRYRDNYYSVIRAFTYPESEKTQHEREQYKIDKNIKSRSMNNYNGNDLDWSKTSLLEASSKYGWLAPNGKFYGCGYREHSLQASLVHKKTEHELEEEGWIKITMDSESRKPRALMHSFSGARATRKQLDYLATREDVEAKDIFYIHDYKEE